MGFAQDVIKSVQHAADNHIIVLLVNQDSCLTKIQELAIKNRNQLQAVVIKMSSLSVLILKLSILNQRNVGSVVKAV